MVLGLISVHAAYSAQKESFIRLLSRKKVVEMSYEGLVDCLPFVYENKKSWEPELKGLKWHKIGYVKIGTKRVEKIVKDEKKYVEEDIWVLNRKQYGDGLSFSCGNQDEILLAGEELFTPARAMMEIINETDDLQVYNITCNSDALDVLMIDYPFGILDKKHLLGSIQYTKQAQNTKIVTIYYKNDLTDLYTSFYITLEQKKLPYKASKEWERVKQNPEDLDNFLMMLREDMFPTAEKKTLRGNNGGYNVDKPEGIERIPLQFAYESDISLKAMEERELLWLESEGRGPTWVKKDQERLRRKEEEKRKKAAEEKRKNEEAERKKQENAEGKKEEVEDAKERAKSKKAAKKGAKRS